MVIGINKFKEWFKGYENQYVVIGGTACDILFAEAGLSFRATRDIDLVLIVEVLTAEFCTKFWEFIKAAEYEHLNKSTGNVQFYRFSKPKNKDYPTMIELFSNKPENLSLPDDAILAPIPMEEEISSLSAILMDDVYYKFLRSGTIVIDGITVLSEYHLIPFKAKAWLDLQQRLAQGEHIDSKDIKKHRNDVFKLISLLNMKEMDIIPPDIKKDMSEFIVQMTEENINLKALSLAGTKEELVERLRKVYLE